MKVLFVTMALIFLLLASCYIDSAMGGDSDAIVSSAFCDSKCKVRCSRARNRCMNFCLICCKSCNCVPSGFYGNKDECPCYRDKVTSGPIKKPKCP